MKRRSEQGVALVITLILLSVITFMAVTFLAISRRERESVTNRAHQNDAVFAANAGLEQAKVQFMAAMLAHTNGFSILGRDDGFDSGAFVSTNYINPAGFITGLYHITNASYNYSNGAPIVGSDLLINLTNLLILPRPPVFVFTNRPQAVGEFRYYLDLNRNGRYDTNGLITLQDTNGNPILDASNNPITRFMMGDPEWIGVLNHPDQPHSRSNFFNSRYAFIALPIGNSLDINYIHNQAKYVAQPDTDGFLRDQGFGTWEINLAAFLYEINPSLNAWGNLGFTYRTNIATPSTGYSFQDAANVVKYRYGGDYKNLLSVSSLYGAAGNNAFRNDYIDGYSAGPLRGTFFTLGNDLDATFRGWSGADNPVRFYTLQDLFKVPPITSTAPQLGFSNTLYNAGLQADTTNRYTYYNLLSQLGMGSMPDDRDKINLNYKNVDGLAATNFVNWKPLEFFTNTANRLLANAGYNFTITNIQVYPTNFYTPAVHRLLQLTANIYDASTNRPFESQPSTNLFFPTVFRPVFAKTATNIIISGYMEEGRTEDYLAKPRDLSVVSDVTSLQPNDNVYGIPYVIGAKKGFPNFNEFSMATISQMTRKAKLTRTSESQPQSLWKTNIMYILGVSNQFAVELWNSYKTPYSRDIDLLVTNEVTAVLTNDMGWRQTNFYTMGMVKQLSGAGQQWQGCPVLTVPLAEQASLLAPLNTNLLFLPNSVYQFALNSFTTNLNVNFPTDGRFYTPQWGVNVTNRVRVIMRDSLTKRLIDYVQLTDLDSTNQLTRLAQPLANTNAFTSLWNTNRPGNSTGLNVPFWGLIYQVGISLGQYTDNDDTHWGNYGAGQPQGKLREIEIDKFRYFNKLGPIFGHTFTYVTNEAFVPFTPTAQFVDYKTWQANDPLVHYLSDDIVHPDQNSIPPQPLVPVVTTPTNFLANIRRLNERFRPWAGKPDKAEEGDPTATDPAYKDGLIYRSDDWQFPTNKFPNIGWLGRVHRGTPWQTVHLKSSLVDSNLWEKWTGNIHRPLDALTTRPTNDWQILDLFTVAANDNASMGQLSVNQSGLASWAAVLSGVLTVTNTTDAGGLGKFAVPSYASYVIHPVTNDAALTNIVKAINDVRRTNNYAHVFTNIGGILSVPELTINSPFLNKTGEQPKYGISDEAYERIPQQILSLLKTGESRYVIYAYGQSLRPADRSIVQTSGLFFGMCTNYTITGESAIRAVVRVVNRPVPGQKNAPPQVQPQIIVEEYNALPPE